METVRLITCVHCYHNVEIPPGAKVDQESVRDICDSLTCQRYRDYCKQRRLEQMNWQRGPRQMCDAELIVSCVLHVGFIHIEETEEQLEILRRPEPTPPPRKPRSGYATSQLGSQLIQLSPIDHTAMRVTR